MGAFKRSLTATAMPAPLFANAIGITDITNGSILLFGGTAIDSWDSDPNRDYNPDGIGTVAYSFTAGLKSNYAAVIAAPFIELRDNTTLYGYASTFANPITLPPPPTPFLLIKGPTTVGSLDSTRVSKSAFVPNFLVTAPTGAGQPGPPVLDGNTVTLDNTGGVAPKIWDSSSTNLTISGKTVTISGSVIIRVPGNLSLQAAGKIIINPGAQLEIFVGQDINISPGSGFQNLTLEPKRLALYSTNPSKTRVFDFNSSMDFCGVIYSAAADTGVFHSTPATIGFNSNPTPVVYGAIFANDDVRFNASASPQLHYDLALQYLPKGWFKGVTTPFMITQVTETP